MLLFQNVLDPDSGEPMLIEVEGNDYRDAHEKLQRRLQDLARQTAEMLVVSPGLARTPSLSRYVAATSWDSLGMPSCACCFRTV